jgi:hypothetical protein
LGLLAKELLPQKTYLTAQGFVLGEQRVNVGGDLGAPGRRTGQTARIKSHLQSA